MTQEVLDHARVRLPPPFVLIGHLGTALLLAWLLHLPDPAPLLLEIPGAGLMLAGFVLALGAVREMQRARTSVDPYQPVKALVTAGPYRYTRNPIYLGFLCELIGLPLVFGSGWGLILSPLFVLVMTRLVIRPEEVYLEQKFGQTYLQYTSLTRRWL